MVFARKIILFCQISTQNESEPVERFSDSFRIKVDYDKKVSDKFLEKVTS